LTPLQLRVFIALLSYWDPKRPGKPVWASPATLAQDVGLQGKHAATDVRKAIGALEGLGYLKRISDKGKRYRISLEPLLTKMEGESP
ncbi:MAG: hypothetical protein GTN65_11405, partial [Armatimonadetes bacterium]|nr:hypothetical protein [Armatimonadota bacterium]NIO97673.1 hypothetical protein [Armatimonadota bacterium]